MPVATGLSLSLCLMSLKSSDIPLRRRIIFSRIDQVSCVKAVSQAGLLVHTVDQCMDPDTGEYCTDLNAIRNLIEQHGADEVLAVVICTSCFAPRSPDDVVSVSEICKEFGISLVVNNAYGLICSKTTQMIQDACARGRLDYVVQSLDKNFMVPVGGSVVFSNVIGRIPTLCQTYPGRAHANHIIDLFITFLSMGLLEWREIRRRRRELFEYVKREMLPSVCEVMECRVIPSSANRISIAIALPPYIGDLGIGGKLYHRGVSGAKVLSPKKFGLHGLCESDDCYVIVFAVSVESCQEDYKVFFKYLDDLLSRERRKEMKLDAFAVQQGFRKKADSETTSSV
eukprot:GHVH01001137.1.p1 GENE.GHVH01001137.1~~GHVH01001137.1.p1  ORF type:complete len:341 (+),score=31.95 GHVH01001137.1:472-1494(+)